MAHPPSPTLNGMNPQPVFANAIISPVKSRQASAQRPKPSPNQQKRKKVFPLLGKPPICIQSVARPLFLDCGLLDKIPSLSMNYISNECDKYFFYKPPLFFLIRHL
jgi:hypothetical protein